MCYPGNFSLRFYDYKKRSRRLSVKIENENPYGLIIPLAAL